MQVSLNTQNASCNYLTPTFKGILVKNEGMKKILTKRDIAELQKVDTRKVSLMCMQKAVDAAEYEFFDKYPECKAAGMAKLCRNAIRGKALELLNSTNERKEIDFEVIPTYERSLEGSHNYYIDFYPCNFQIPFVVGYGKHALTKDKDIDLVQDLFKEENSESLKWRLDFYASTKGYKDFSFRYRRGYEVCYEKLVNKNDDIKSLLESPLYKKVQQLEQLKKEIKEIKNSTKGISKSGDISPKIQQVEDLKKEIEEITNKTEAMPVLARIPVHKGHYEEINDEFGSERTWVWDK